MANSLKRATPTILSCLSAVGTIGTAVLTAMETPKAMQDISEAKKEKELSKLDMAKIAAPHYIPSIAACTATLACIFGANVLSRRQQASLASAYALVNTSFKEYKQKLKDIYGEEAHQEIERAIAAEKCKDQPIYASTFGTKCSLDVDGFDRASDLRLFYDSFSGRYFESTMVKVIEAEYHLNRNFMLAGSLSLNDFYSFLGLKPCDGGDEIGWSGWVHDIYWLDFNHNKTTLDDGLECIIIDMIFEPTADYMEAD